MKRVWGGVTLVAVSMIVTLVVEPMPAWRKTVEAGK